jgi:hypothetical protein
MADERLFLAAMEKEKRKEKKKRKEDAARFGHDEVMRRRTRFMASMSIGRAAKSEDFFLPHA